MENSNEQKIVGVVIDNKLNLKSHISGLCKKKLYLNCQTI